MVRPSTAGYCGHKFTSSLCLSLLSLSAAFHVLPTYECGCLRTYRSTSTEYSSVSERENSVVQREKTLWSQAIHIVHTRYAYIVRVAAHRIVSKKGLRQFDNKQQRASAYYCCAACGCCAPRMYIDNKHTTGYEQNKQQAGRQSSACVYDYAPNKRRGKSFANSRQVVLCSRRFACFLVAHISQGLCAALRSDPKTKKSRFRMFC